MKKYPNEFYRGVSKNQENFDPNGYLTRAAFQFKCNPKRRDDYEEMSINWNDSPKSLENLLKAWNYRKGEYLASHGYICISLAFIHYKFEGLISNGVLKYERCPVKWNLFKKQKANKFHGNLLLLKKRKKDKVAFQEEMANFSNFNLITREAYLKAKKLDAPFLKRNPSQSRRTCVD